MRDYTKVTKRIVDTLTEAEKEQEAYWMAQCEEAYNTYSALRSCYEYLINKEYDPIRKQRLEAMLEDLNEENK